MSRTIKFLIFSLTFAFSSQVFAGRDESQLLLQDKEDKAVIAARLHDSVAENQERQLDHGPRAMTSQWVAKSEHMENLKEAPLVNSKHKSMMTRLELKKHTGS